VSAAPSALAVRIQTIPSSNSEPYQDSRRAVEHRLTHELGAKSASFMQIGSLLSTTLEITMNTTGSAGLRCLTALIALLALIPVTAKAADLLPDGVLASLSKKISLGDLDLTTDQGLQIASERIHQTARRLCTQVQDSRDLAHRSAVVRCIDRAVASASSELRARTHRGAAPAVASIPPKQDK